MFYTDYNSQFGRLLLASDGKNLTGLWFEGQKYYADTLSNTAIKKDDLPIFAQVKKWLNAYFAGEHITITNIPLMPQGSNFRQKVWKILCDIPYGKVITYGDIAKRIGGRISAQAVGSAVSHNPISIIIPCHRVVGAKGKLTGYAAGISTKEKLLKLEGIIAQ